MARFQKIDLKLLTGARSFIVFVALFMGFKQMPVLAEELPGTIKNFERVLLGQERLILEEVPQVFGEIFWEHRENTFINLQKPQALGNLSIWTLRKKNEEDRFFIKLVGSFLEPKRSLLINGFVAKIQNPETSENSKSEGAPFVQFIEIFGESTPIEWISLDENGNTNTLVTTVEVDTWEKLSAKKPIRPIGVNFWTAGLGFNYLSYFETQVVDLTLISSQARFGFSRQFAKRWDFAAQATSTLVHFYKSAHKDKSIHLITANIRAGYIFPFVTSPYQMSLMGGLAYQRLFVSNHAFGFKNLIYPQIYPVLNRVFSNGGLAHTYFRYVPLNEDYKVNLRERELGFGLGYQFPPNLNGKYWALGFDYSDTKVQPVKNYHVKAKTYALSISRRL